MRAVQIVPNNCEIVSPQFRLSAQAASVDRINDVGLFCHIVIVRNNDNCTSLNMRNIFERCDDALRVFTVEVAGRFIA